LQHGELVAEYEDLGVFGAITSAAYYEEVEHEPGKLVETPHAPILAASAREFRCRREVAGHERGQVFGTDKVARGRLRGGLENPSHPFETMAAGLVRHVVGTTGITIELPSARPADTRAA
jgi:hypothetical protein